MIRKIMELIAALSIGIRCQYAECHYAKCHCAEHRGTTELNSFKNKSKNIHTEVLYHKLLRKMV